MKNQQNLLGAILILLTVSLPALFSVSGLFIPDYYGKGYGNVSVSSMPVFLHQSKAKYHYVFFGYTSCHNICPAALKTLRQLKLLLHKNGLDADFYLVSVDEKNESPESLLVFEKNNNGIFGVPWKEGKVLANSLGIYRSTQGTEIDHSGSIYLITPQRDVLLYPYRNNDAEKMQRDLEKIEIKNYN